MTILGFLVLIGLPGYLVLQAYTAWTWRGGWRVAALVPLLMMVPLAVLSAYAFAAGSNLWPLPLIFLAPFPFAYLAAVGFTKALVA